MSRFDLHASFAPLAVATLVLLAGCSDKSDDAKKKAEAEAPRSVRFVSVETRSLDSGLSAQGRLVSREEAAVSAQVQGYQVARVLVDQSAWVKAGDVLAELDDTLLRADIDQQRANLAQVRVAAEKAEQEAARVAGLDGTGVLSKEAIAERRLNAKSARAQVAQAEALLRAQEVRQSLMKIRAPVTGRVLERTVRPGDVAATNVVLFRIARDGEVEVAAEIPEQSVDQVHVGDRADILLPSGARAVGTVRLVASLIDPDTRLGHARVLLPVREDLRPGGFADVQFRQQATDVRAIREGAVSYGANGASLTVIGADNVVSVAPVKTGRRGGGYVELVEGPAAGTRALLGSQGFVLEGDKVSPIPADPLPATAPSPAPAPATPAPAAPSKAR